MRFFDKSISDINLKLNQLRRSQYQDLIIYQKMIKILLFNLSHDLKVEILIWSLKLAILNITWFCKTI